MYAVMLLAVTVLSCVLLAPGLQDQLQKVGGRSPAAAAGTGQGAEGGQGCV